MYANQQIITSI